MWACVVTEVKEDVVVIEKKMEDRRVRLELEKKENNKGKYDIDSKEKDDNTLYNRDKGRDKGDKRDREDVELSVSAASEIDQMGATNV